MKTMERTNIPFQSSRDNLGALAQDKHEAQGQMYFQGLIYLTLMDFQILINSSPYACFNHQREKHFFQITS